MIKEPKVSQGGITDSVEEETVSSSSYNNSTSSDYTSGNQNRTTKLHKKGKVTWREFKPASTYVVTPSVRNYWETLLEGFNKDSCKFVYHLKATTGELLIKIKSGYHPIYSKWREKHFPKAEIGELELAGIIQIDHSYSVDKHECKKYRINPEILKGLTDLVLQDLISLNHTRYDLIKGRVNNKVIVSTVHNESGDKIPELVAQRIEAYTPSKFSWGGILKVVIMRREEANELKERYGCQAKAYRSAYSRYTNDLDKLSKLVTEGGAVQLEGDTWAYLAPFKAQKSGRITHIGGGFQSASRQFTAAAFINITGYNNYDMVSAQPNCMAQLLDSLTHLDETLALGVGFIRTEILDKEAKAALFERCGVRKQTGKDFLIAQLIGSPFVDASQKTSDRFKQVSKRVKEWIAAQETGDYYKLVSTLDGDIKSVKIKNIKLPATISLLLKEFNNDPKLAFEALQKINHNFAPLIKAINAYRVLIIRLIRPKTEADKQLAKPDWIITHKGKTYIKNKCDARLCVDDIPTQSLVSKVTAHLLQGMEAAYMSHIVQLGAKHGYEPVQDFHDGAIIKGVVPVEAQLEAARLSGVEGKLEIKEFEDPFVDKNLLNEELKRWGLLNNTTEYDRQNMIDRMESNGDQEDIDESDVALAELIDSIPDVEAANNIIDFRREFELTEAERYNHTQQLSYEDAYYILDGFAEYDYEVEENQFDYIDLFTSIPAASSEEITNNKVEVARLNNIISNHKVLTKEEFALLDDEEQVEQIILVKNFAIARVQLNKLLSLGSV